MDRFDTYRDDRNYRGNDYGSYEGYSRNDEHYHHARNLTDEFEQHYRRHGGYGEDDRNHHHNDHTYNEGNLGNRYDRRRREESSYSSNSGYSDHDRDQNRNDYGYYDRDRNRYSGYGIDYRRDNYEEDQEQYLRARDRGQQQGGNRRAGYLMSYYDGSLGGFTASDRDHSRGGDYNYNHATREVNYDRESRYSDRNYNDGFSTRNVDERSIPGRRSYLQNRYY